jgi:hypothetical protein
MEPEMILNFIWKKKHAGIVKKTLKRKRSRGTPLPEKNIPQ